MASKSYNCRLQIDADSEFNTTAMLYIMYSGSSLFYTLDVQYVNSGSYLSQISTTTEGSDYLIYNLQFINGKIVSLGSYVISSFKDTTRLKEYTPPTISQDQISTVSSYANFLKNPKIFSPAIPAQETDICVTPNYISANTTLFPNYKLLNVGLGEEELLLSYSHLRAECASYCGYNCSTDCIRDGIICTGLCPFDSCMGYECSPDISTSFTQRFNFLWPTEGYSNVSISIGGTQVATSMIDSYNFTYQIYGYYDVSVFADGMERIKNTYYLAGGTTPIIIHVGY